MPDKLASGSVPLLAPITESEVAERSLIEREARGLLWSIHARLTFIAVALVVIPFIVKGTTEAIAFIGSYAAGGVLMVYCRALARGRRRLQFVGLAGVAFDLALVGLGPAIRYASLVGSDAGLAGLMKAPFPTIWILFIVINSMALRPLYPALVATGAVVMLVVIGALGLGDPRTVVTNDMRQALSGEAVHAGLYFAITVIVALCGAFLSLLARAARNTIREVVALEHTNLQIREKQAELVMQGKMDAMASLVAGVAHEINTPLGVVMSSVSTSGDCAPRISRAIETAQSTDELKEDRNLRRVLQVLSENPKVAIEAGRRIARLVSSLKEFAQLDAAEVQEADLRQGLDSSLELIKRETKGKVQVITEYGDIPEILCRPKELNQVFMTLLVNAFEAIEGEGTLTIRVGHSAEQVTVEIQDTGKGIPPEKLSRLYDIGFAAKSGRVGMGLGLPTSHNIVRRHGGSLKAESEVGKGSTFRIVLPIAAVPHEPEVSAAAQSQSN